MGRRDAAALCLVKRCLRALSLRPWPSAAKPEVQVVQHDCMEASLLAAHLRCSVCMYVYTAFKKMAKSVAKDEFLICNSALQRPRSSCDKSNE